MNCIFYLDAFNLVRDLLFCDQVYTVSVTHALLQPEAASFCV